MNTRIAKFTKETTQQLTTFNSTTRQKTIFVPKGETKVIGEVKGTGYISNIWITFPGWFYQWWNPPAPISQTILKTLILRIYWDDEKLPAVEAPVGDFFGIGLCEVGNFANRYFGMSSGGFFCKFPMPFQRGFRIEVENRDQVVDTDIFANVLYQLDPDLDRDLGYFHTHFSTGKGLTEAFEMCSIEGRGHYVGCSLSMQGEQLNNLSFLEAPEYVYIDNEKQPRLVGTGLEDYFCGGWYFREGPFIGPFHGVPIKDALNSLIAMYRIHEADRISFSQGLRFMFKHPFKDYKDRFAYSSVTYLYLEDPAGTGRGLPGPEELLCWYRVRNTDHQSIP
ncbi:MAG: DUF2961 domain-containing protein [Limnochordia bacterium]|nr:DUF2961 domain-containing protein [Limnochordia bacterium]